MTNYLAKLLPKPIGLLRAIAPVNTKEIGVSLIEA